MAKIGILPALSQPIFALYAGAANFSFIATWIQRTAAGWLIWEMTQSTLWLGLLSFGYLIPVVLISPIGGVLADRFSNLRILMTAQALLAIAALFLAVLVAQERISPLILVLVAVVQGMVEAFSQTAQLSLVPVVAQGRNIPSAIAVTSVSFNTSRFIGPALAGVLLLWAGASLTFALSAVGFVIFLVGLLIVGRFTTENEPQRGQSFSAALSEGLAYVLKDRLIGIVMLLMILIGVLGRQTLEMLPGVAEGIFHSGAFGLSVLTSAAGMGAILAGVLGQSETKSGHAPEAALHQTVHRLAFANIFFALLPELWSATVGAGLLGYLIARAGIMAQTLLNLHAEAPLRGRVLSYYGVVFRGGPAFGALAIGALSELIGLRWAIAISGVALYIACTSLTRTSKR